MKKTNKYWIEQAKLPAPEGYVCIGKGSSKYSEGLSSYFSRHDLFSEESGSQFLENNWHGNLDYKLYYVTIKTWEEKTGVKFKRSDESNENKTNMNKIKTESTPALAELVCEMMQGKAIDCRVKFFNFGYLYLDDTGVSQASNDFLNEYTEVSASEFIAALENLPDKPKEIVIDILPWRVIIKGDKVDIGCKKDKNLETFKNTIFNGFSSVVGTKDFYGATVYFGKNGFLVYGEMVSWETWGKFVEELKKVK